ncbi:MAG: DUF2461 domain-containing protein [Bacteroidia bacterium]|nr:DUF2461 domain-containing protein [Bacteroidia bacterium]
MNTRIIFDFLSALQNNNNKDWFHANKDKYNLARYEFEKLVETIIPEIISFDKRIGIIHTKDCMFRIYRDVRFSADKRPYKTNFGAYIVKGGKKSNYAGYYIHFEPESSFLGGGIYCPPPENLKVVREAIYYETEAFKKIINDKRFKTYFGSISGDKLKNPPHGYDKNFADIELLKFKDYTILHDISDNLANDKKGINKIITIFKAMLGFNNFINEAIENR